LAPDAPVAADVVPAVLAPVVGAVCTEAVMTVVVVPVADVPVVPVVVVPVVPVPIGAPAVHTTVAFVSAVLACASAPTLALRLRVAWCATTSAATILAVSPEATAALRASCAAKAAAKFVARFALAVIAPLMAAVRLSF